MCFSVRTSLVLMLSVTICSMASAQSTSNRNDPGTIGSSADTGRLAIEELVGQGGDSLALKYDDLPQEYGGFRRSPILFNREKGRNRFPSLSTFSMDAGMNPNSRERTWEIDSLPLSPPRYPPLDLSTDDEIERSTLAATRPLIDLENEFSSSEVHRDNYLDSFQSIRGIANLTLSYLDKTVAAGLATTQQQADMDGIKQLLRQVSLNTAKTANPQRRRVYDDLDEKFEACMTGEKEGLWVGSPQFATRYPDDAKKITFDAYNICQVPSPNSPCAKHLASKGRYNFCVCCTETFDYAVKSTTGADINWNDVEGSARRGITFYGEGYSLLDRAFLGRRVPSGFLRERKPIPGASNDPESNIQRYEAGYLIYDFSTLIRALYGDVIYTREQVRRDGQAPNSRKYIRRTVPPLLSVPQWVQALRDAASARKVHPFDIALAYDEREQNPQNRGWWENHEGMWLRYSPAMGAAMKCGVCPAMKALLRMEKDNVLDDFFQNSGSASMKGEYQCDESVPAESNPTEHVKSLWADMSIGGAMMTVADLRAIAEIMDTSEGQRFISTFCDTSAVEGMKRLHRRVQTLALDFLAANTKISNEERETIKQLMDRVSTYLELGTKDSRSQVDEMLLALGASRDRRQEANRSAIVAATGASENRTRLLGQILQPFGGALPQ